MRAVKKFTMVVWVVTSLAIPVGFAQEEPAKPELDEETFRDVAGELRCPTCTGLSVLDSEASFSVQIKDQVRAQLEEGRNKDEILQFFTERYGPWILREPPKEGFHVLAWLIPIALLILGPILVWFFVWRRKIEVSNFGVRTREDIIAEMQEALRAMRRG